MYREEFSIREMDFARAGEASIRIKNVLKEIGADPKLVHRAAICAYEAEMNEVMYGQGGRMTLELTEDRILILVEDDGPGIEDLDMALTEGYSTATHEMREMGFGAGMGLPNINRNAGRFTIDSAPGRGSRLEIVFDTGWREPLE
jgi:anti-sigma regulatory factor (Ser/Thr protein kinase)